MPDKTDLTVDKSDLSRLGTFKSTSSRLPKSTPRSGWRPWNKCRLKKCLERRSIYAYSAHLSYFGQWSGEKVGTAAEIIGARRSDGSVVFSIVDRFSLLTVNTINHELLHLNSPGHVP